MLKKLFYVSLLALLSANFTFAQSKTNEQIEAQIKRLNRSKNIELAYDEAGGNTKIFARGEDFGREADKRAGVENFSFGAAFFYANKILSAAPRDINLTFWVAAKKPRFADAHRLTVFAGGETLDLGEARYVSKPKENMEYLNFVFPREVFAKIAKSPDARMKIGNSEFKFTAEHLKTFDALAKISDPSVL